MNSIAQRVVSACILVVAGTMPATADFVQDSARQTPSDCAHAAGDKAGEAERSDAAIASTGAFGLRLLDAVSGGGQENALVSPIGVGVVLELLAQGAKESVRESIRDMIGSGNSGTENSATESAGGNSGAPATMVCGLQWVVSAAEQDDGVDVAIANAVFAEHSLDLFPSFSAVARGSFGARTQRLNFADESSVARINDWVASATDGRIPRLVSHLEPDDVLVLTNAINFHGEWARRFDSELTVPTAFHLRSGASPEVSTMHADDMPGRYREDEDFQAIALPYGEGQFELVVVLPRAGMASSEVLRSLTSDSSWLGERGFAPARGSLSLPSLKLHEEASILPALRALGLEEALGDAQAFAGIAAPAPQLTRVLHQATLVLDERGTQATAATAAVLTTRSLLKATFDMQMDRPFVLAVRHRRRNAVLFAAWIEDPTQAVASATR